MPLLSIIIPVYNVEQYLERCIESIINQTLKDLEIILVNDGSTDRSGEICERYANQDNRILVINKKNGGVSSARNVGLEIARGEWIAFVDSDDYIEKNMYEILYKNAIKYDVEVSSCFFKYLTADDTVLFNPTENHLKLNKIFKGIEFLELLYIDSYTNGLCVSMWNKIYKKKIFQQLRFPINTKYEDDEICHKIYLQDINVYCDTSGFYIYVQNLNSLSHMEFKEKNLVFLEIINNRITSFNEASLENLKIQSLILYFNIVIEYYFKIKSIEKVFNFKMYKKLYKTYLLQYLFSQKFSNKDKIRWYLFLINPFLYKKFVLRSK